MVDTSATLISITKKKLKQEIEPYIIFTPELSKPIHALRIARLLNLHTL